MLRPWWSGAALAAFMVSAGPATAAPSDFWRELYFGASVGLGAASSVITGLSGGTGNFCDVGGSLYTLADQNLPLRQRSYNYSGGMALSSGTWGGLPIDVAPAGFPNPGLSVPVGLGLTALGPPITVTQSYYSNTFLATRTTTFDVQPLYYGPSGIVALNDYFGSNNCAIYVPDGSNESLGLTFNTPEPANTLGFSFPSGVNILTGQQVMGTLSGGASGSSNPDLSGFIGTVYVGYLWPLNDTFVLGVEGDVGFSGLGGATALATAGIDWMGSIRGRAGMILPETVIGDVMIYLTAGVAVGGAHVNSVSGGIAGMTFGAGTEWLFSDFVAMRLEQRVTSFGAAQFGTATGSFSVASTMLGVVAKM